MRTNSARSLQAFAGLVLAHHTVGQVLTTYNPCPQDTTVTPVTVTAQYQPVSTCYPFTECSIDGNCSTTYVYKTYDFVSTVIPCAYNGVTASTCTITATDDIVALSTATTTLTRTVTSGPQRHHRNSRVHTVFELRERKFEVEYDAIGPLGIPGYAGSGLCDTCEGPAGILEQAVVITECRLRSDQQQRECRRKKEVWIQLPVEMRSAPATAVCSSRFQAPSAGVYTFSFEQMAPPRVVTAAAHTITIYVHGKPTAHLRPSQTLTIPGHPWHAVVTQTCTDPTIIDFTTTITTIVTVTAPTITVSPQPSSTSTLSTTSSSSATTSSSGTSSTSAMTSSVTNGGATNTLTTITTVLTSSSTSTSTSSTSTAVSNSELFNIEARDIGLRVRKRAIRYVSFNQDNAVLGDGLNPAAAAFQLASNGSLTSDGAFIGTAQLINSQQLSKFITNPSGAQIWRRDIVTNQLFLAGASRFCFDSTNNLYAIFQETNFICSTVSLFAVPFILPTSSSTTSAATTTSSSITSPSASSSVTTTTSAFSNTNSSFTTLTTATSIPSSSLSSDTTTTTTTLGSTTTSSTVTQSPSSTFTSTTSKDSSNTSSITNTEGATTSTTDENTTTVTGTLATTTTDTSTTTSADTTGTTEPSTPTTTTTAESTTTTTELSLTTTTTESATTTAESSLTTTATDNTSTTQPSTTIISTTESTTVSTTELSTTTTTVSDITTTIDTTGTTGTATTTTTIDTTSTTESSMTTTTDTTGTTATATTTTTTDTTSTTDSSMTTTTTTATTVAATITGKIALRTNTPANYAKIFTNDYGTFVASDPDAGDDATEGTFCYITASQQIQDCTTGYPFTSHPDVSYLTLGYNGYGENTTPLQCTLASVLNVDGTTPLQCTYPGDGSNPAVTSHFYSLDGQSALYYPTDEQKAINNGYILVDFYFNPIV